MWTMHSGRYKGRDRFNREQVSDAAQARDDSGRRRRDKRFLVDTLPLVDVCDVHFDDRAIERLECIEERNRFEAKPGGINDDSACRAAGFMYTIDQLSLVVRLSEIYFEAMILCALRAASLYIVKRFAAI